MKFTGFLRDLLLQGYGSTKQAQLGENLGPNELPAGHASLHEPSPMLGWTFG